MTLPEHRGARDGAAATESATAARRGWIGALARALPEELERAFTRLPAAPAYRVLRAPETGLIMVRGRAGGSGAPFNAGEMTVTRCSVQTAAGVVGHGYVAGRAPRHAELAAVFDALFQELGDGQSLRDDILPELTRADAERRAKRAGETMPTKVEFFTLVRGED